MRSMPSGTTATGLKAVLRNVVAIIAAMAIGCVLPGAPASAETSESPSVAESLTTDSAGVHTLTTRDASSGATTSIITEITLYSPAPGVTGSQLHSSLAELGTAGLQPLDTRSDRSTCGLGNATTLGCPRYRWNPYRPDLGFPGKINILINGASTLLTEAAPRWRNPAFNVSTSSACPLLPGIRCFYVMAANYGATGWTEKSTAYHNSRAPTSLGAGQIWLNSYYDADPTRQLGTLCHGIGHILGLGHSTSPASCMYASNGTAIAPDSDDLTLVSDVYALSRTPYTSALTR